jgi:6-phosphofructokinase 1
VLGHVQRGGAPNAFDCALAASFGAEAVQAICDHKNDVFVSWNGVNVETKAFTTIAGHIKRVLPTTAALRAAKGLGIYCGEVG